MAQESITLRADPATVARWAADALQRLALDEHVDSDPTGSYLMIVLPRSWASFGERVTAVIEREGTGSRVEVRSVGVYPQLIHWGVHRRNVEAVIHALASLDSG